jgi:hypothetical protein
MHGRMYNCGAEAYLMGCLAGGCAVLCGIQAGFIESAADKVRVNLCEDASGHCNCTRVL